MATKGWPDDPFLPARSACRQCAPIPPSRCARSSSTDTWIPMCVTTTKWVTSRPVAGARSRGHRSGCRSRPHERKPACAPHIRLDLSSGSRYASTTRGSPATGLQRIALAGKPSGDRADRSDHRQATSETGAPPSLADVIAAVDGGLRRTAETVKPHDRTAIERLRHVGKGARQSCRSPLTAEPDVAGNDALRRAPSTDIPWASPAGAIPMDGRVPITLNALPAAEGGLYDMH